MMYLMVSNHFRDKKEQWSIGEIEGEHPKSLPKTRKDRPLFSLRTDDIPGMNFFPQNF